MCNMRHNTRDIVDIISNFEKFLRKMAVEKDKII